VRDLYKGGAWALALVGAQFAVARGGAVRIVSAGLGLAELNEQAPGYDITFSEGNPNTVPGGGSFDSRASWWRAIGGCDALNACVERLQPSSVLVALPAGYLDAVAPTLRAIADRMGDDLVCALACKPSARARDLLAPNIIPVKAAQTTTLQGNAGQAPLSALAYVLAGTEGAGCLDRRFVEERLAQLATRDTPLYPKRQRVGPDHAADWITKALGSPQPPASASEALRRYRAAGFALEQKHFHGIFANVRGETCP